MLRLEILTTTTKHMLYVYIITRLRTLDTVTPRINYYHNNTCTIYVSASLFGIVATLLLLF